MLVADTIDSGDCEELIGEELVIITRYLLRSPLVFTNSSEAACEAARGYSAVPVQGKLC